MPHIHEKIDFCSEVFIICRGKVLLRKHDKYDIWLSIGGHVELDEDPSEAAIREVKEEVGLDVTLVGAPTLKDEKYGYRGLIMPVFMGRHRVSLSHEHVVFVYFGRSDSDKVTPEKETDEWRWCEEKDLLNLGNIPENVVYYARCALRDVK